MTENEEIFAVDPEASFHNPDDAPEGVMRNFVRHIKACEVGTGKNMLDLGDPKMEGGFLMFNKDGEENEEWVWLPRSIFLENYQEVS